MIMSGSIHFGHGQESMTTVATSDATAPADTNFTDGKDYSGDTDGIELDEEE